MMFLVVKEPIYLKRRMDLMGKTMRTLLYHSQRKTIFLLLTPYKGQRKFSITEVFNKQLLERMGDILLGSLMSKHEVIQRYIILCDLLTKAQRTQWIILCIAFCLWETNTEN